MDPCAIRQRAPPYSGARRHLNAGGSSRRPALAGVCGDCFYPSRRGDLLRYGRSDSYRPHVERPSPTWARLNAWPRGIWRHTWFLRSTTAVCPYRAAP